MPARCRTPASPRRCAGRRHFGDSSRRQQLLYAADWFEVTNTGTTAVDITGWKIDDNSNAFGSAVALRGVTSIAAGKSAVFFEAAPTARPTRRSSRTSRPPGSAARRRRPASDRRLRRLRRRPEHRRRRGQSVRRRRQPDHRRQLRRRHRRRHVRQHGRPRQHDASAADGLDARAPPGSTARSSRSTARKPARRAARQRVAATGVDLSIYVRVGRFDLPEPTRTVAARRQRARAGGLGGHLQLGHRHAVRRRRRRHVDRPGDEDRAADRLDDAGARRQSARHRLLRSGRPDLRRRRPVRHGRGARSAGGPVHLCAGHHADARAMRRPSSSAPSRNIGHRRPLLRSADAADSSSVKETQPQGIFQTGIDFAAGTATNGSPTTVNSINLFDPALLGLLGLRRRVSRCRICRR